MERDSAIAVLVHAQDTAFESTRYLLSLLMKEWESMGLPLRVIRGTARFVPADLLIPHVDLTVTPGGYRDFQSRYPAVVNGRVFDISKSRISRNLVAKSDEFNGPVIVKTDRNYGGLPEQRLRRRSLRSLTSHLARAVAARLQPRSRVVVSWKHVEHLHPDRYPVFGRLRDVPDGVFENEHLVVEKFIVEKDADLHCLRYCYFLGDR